MGKKGSGWEGGRGAIRSSCRYVILWATPPSARGIAGNLNPTLADAIEFGMAHPHWGPDSVWDAVARRFVHDFRGTRVYRRPSEAHIAPLGGGLE